MTDQLFTIVIKIFIKASRKQILHATSDQTAGMLFPGGRLSDAKLCATGGYFYNIHLQYGCQSQAN